MPVCNVCGKDKPVDMFPRNGKDKDGNERRRRDCTVCYTVSRKTNCSKGKSHYKKFVNNMYHRTGEIVDLTLEEWRRCLIYFEGKCAYCGKQQSRSVRLTKDHLVPCVEGGKTVKRNVIPACTTCNCSKGGSQFEEWYRKQKYFSQVRLYKILIWMKGGGM